MKEIVLFFVTCVVGLVAEEPVVAPPASVAPVIAPKSFLGMRKKLCLQYVATNPVLTSPELKPFSEQISKILTPLTKEDALNRIALRQDIAVLIKALQADKNLRQPLRTKIIHLLANVQHALRPWLGRHWKKIAGGVVALPVSLGVALALLLAYPRFLRANSKFKRRFGGTDRSGNYIPPYALSKVLSDEEKMAITSALKTHPILSKRASMSLRASLRSANTKSFMLAAGLKYREWAERRNAELRRFVVEPNPDGDVWQRAAYALQRVDCLSVEAFARARREAREHVIKRLEELYISPDPATIQYPEHLARESQALYWYIRNILSCPERGVRCSVTALKKPEKEGPKSLEVDNTFVYTFCPPGGGGVILKIPNPYAFYKMQDIYRMMGARGENHSPRRNVDRVLVADAIRQYELEHPEAGITAPQKFLALRPGADRRSITDATAIVMAEALDFRVDPRIKTMTDAEIDRLLDISEIYGLIDLHDDNIKRDQRTEKLTIIDTERVQASWDTLAECYRQENLTNERFYPGVSDRIKARIRERKGMLAK